MIKQMRPLQQNDTSRAIPLEVFGIGFARADDNTKTGGASGNATIWSPALHSIVGGCWPCGLRRDCVVRP